MNNESNRNMIVFMAVAAVILFGYQYLVMGPKQKAEAAKAKAVAAQQQRAKAAGQPTTPDGQPAAIVLTHEQALGPAELRRPIDNAQLQGSLSLRGGRIDDLALKNYREGLDKESPLVQLLKPQGSENSWFTDFRWQGPNLAGLPTADTVWTLKSGDRLAPGHPIVMTYASPQNLMFERTITLDENFMFRISDTVTNNSGGAVQLAPEVRIDRQGLPKPAPGHQPLGGNGIVHEGAIGVFGAKGDSLQHTKYPAWPKKALQTYDAPSWIGITDKYWLVAAAPDPKGAQRDTVGDFVFGPGDIPTYQADYKTRNWLTVKPGETITQATLLFAGAKTVPALRAYQDGLGLKNFDQAIDWGMLSVLTRPFFMFLDFLFKHIGNFGLSILALTVCVRLVLFPLANKSYESMSRMKKLQPQLEELKVKFKDDPAKQQQEMMAIYQREKINPLMGCLPVLIQIPVFFSVYKTLSVTIEMRHAPFFGWIHDLSAQDPTTIWNLFGLIPWHPDAFVILGNHIFTGNLHLGVLPLLYGFTMWLTTAMNPPAPDPMQQRIFSLMPIMFTFIMAAFPVGLLIYWTWSNVLSILQQYLIMHRLKVDNPIDKFFGRFSSKPVEV